MAPGGGGSSSRQVFGQTIRKKAGGKQSSYQRQFGGGGGNKKNATVYRSSGDDAANASAAKAQAAVERRLAKQALNEAIDERFGLERFALTNAASADECRQRRGWLYNMRPTTVTVSSDASMASTGGAERAGLDLFFYTQSGNNFKSTILYRPYFYILPELTNIVTDPSQIDIYLELLVSTIHRMFEGSGLYHASVVSKLDLDQPNHLRTPSKTKTKNQKNDGQPQRPEEASTFEGRPVVKLAFDNTSQLLEVRERIREIVAQNVARNKSNQFQHFGGLQQQQQGSHPQNQGSQQAQKEHLKDPLRLLVDVREYDVPYTVRVCTDLDLRAGTWYTVELTNVLQGGGEGGGGSGNTGISSSSPMIRHIQDSAQDTGGVRLTEPDRESKADPTFLAFDIECTKAPLKFPSADVDEIFMISYMVRTPSGGQGYLICSRSVVSADVHDFEYTPQANYPGPFHIYNEENEKALLERFFAEYERHCPQIVVTYNGDFFDWPFVEARAKHYGIDMFQRIGVEMINDGEYRGRCSVHLDAFHWVQRDSYLPQGAQGLKAVTKYKLGYDPVEVDPEDMVAFAQERPVHMATYSVSDAVATYYLYEKYVHLFIFSLCTIIPMGPEDVLRKGSGTLCETLLMVQACKESVICPNKQVDPLAQFHKGHLLESETYIGGKVECLETGVYRSDIEYEFDLKPQAFQHLIDNIDRDLAFAIEVEGGKDRKDIVNYDEIRSEIIERLELLREQPKRVEKPYIYHLDVGAMYPNIILSNRLQPSAMVNDATCASCDFNQARNGCKRRMDWVWRGDYSPASKSEYERTKDQLSNEYSQRDEPFHELPDREQAALVAERLKSYARKAYRKTKITEEVAREDVVCMREHPFYVDTVRQFRDRRYEYKKMNKSWKKKASSAKDMATKKQCEDKVLVYDSLQVAHKCILNSFYGYVMRKGARWRSMEMAGIVTKTGADIITQARELVEQIGRPLELDTDGIWCILPCSFPDVYSFVATDGSKLKLEYPCVMLNAACHDKFTNHQYQTLVDPERGIYETRSECSIFFEVDGPYRCMVIPASTEEGKLLKKRYAVFNFDGSLAELKGFELKRRGELELIKTFQSQVFQRFLDGNTLIECYESVAEIANHWIDVIDTRGESLNDDELVDLISENRNMSKQLEEYGGQKGTSQTTARRLGEFLGADLIKDKGLNCKFIIAEQPYGAPVTERAIPTAIWKADPAITKHFLRKWLKSPGLDGEAMDMRNILDWDYYLDRLGKTIQKIITIPAALQSVVNPVPRVKHPDWLTSHVSRVNDKFQQQDIRSMFAAKKTTANTPTVDIEDIQPERSGPKRPLVRKLRTSKKTALDATLQDPGNEENAKRTILSSESFPEWLKQKKAQWRKTRRDRDSHATEGSRGTKKSRKPVSIDGFVREANVRLTEDEWHILEIRELSSFDATGAGRTTSGDFIVWFISGKGSMQKVHVSVPRTIYLSAKEDITHDSNLFQEFKRVEKSLPYSKASQFLYEISMAEHVFRSSDWIGSLVSVKNADRMPVLEAVYESGTPLITRMLTQLGAVSRVERKAHSDKISKAFALSDLARVDQPKGEYLHGQLTYKRLFLYIRIDQRTKSGIVCLYSPEFGSGSNSPRISVEGKSPKSLDVTRPSNSGRGNFDAAASCRIWVVKPGSRSGQRNVTTKQCNSMFSHLIETISDTADDDSDYACVSTASTVSVSGIFFVDTEDLALAGVNDAVLAQNKANHGPTMLLLNSNKDRTRIRRHLSCLNALPIISMPFPPGPAHNPSLSTLPSLNWEQPAVQLSLEAYLYAAIVSFPKRVSYSRYGQVPLGNISADENSGLYEVSMSRLFQKHRTLSWASSVCGRPDLGVEVIPSAGTSFLDFAQNDSYRLSQDEIWGEDGDLESPIVRRPGCYRSICVDIDIQDLAVAALSEVASEYGGGHSGVSDPSSPNSVALFDKSFGSTKTGPLGDEMSTANSLPIVRGLICSWLRDAFTAGSPVADELLHNAYRLISNPDSLLFDPSLHRAVHALMKSVFLRLLGEFQSLGCKIIFASFHRLTIETNKAELADAEEQVNFLIKTVLRLAQERSDSSDSLSRLSLRPRSFHSHLVFLDEYNYGAMQLERVPRDLVPEGSEDILYDAEGGAETAISATVVTAWSMMNYLRSETAQEYFRAIIARFSKDAFRKQMKIANDSTSSTTVISTSEAHDELLKFRKLSVNKHFSSYLTRALGEIAKDGPNDAILPPIPTLDEEAQDVALEFVKFVVAIMELDGELEEEVHKMKRSLLAQIGVAEYAAAAAWKNPCPSFILPDVFCPDCQETRDVNLCHVPPREDGEDYVTEWVCEDCGNSYEITEIERRLINFVRRKSVRYQLQDLRCQKTHRVAIRRLASLSESSAGLSLDFSRVAIKEELELLKTLSDLHQLEALRPIVSGLLSGY